MVGLVYLIGSDRLQISKPNKATPTIIVLPFENLSADSEQEYFCDGMAEEILGAI